MFPGYVTIYKDKDEFIHLYFYPGLDINENFYYRDLDLSNCQIKYNTFFSHSTYPFLLNISTFPLLSVNNIDKSSSCE